MMTTLLQITDLRSGYGKKEIVHGVSFSVPQGRLCCVIGANGCGKTTVLKSMLGLLTPISGTVMVRGIETHSMSVQERARHFAYIPQLHVPPFPFTVADVVILGRTPYIGNVAGDVSETDKMIAYSALKQLAIEHLTDRVYTELSGGQQQLVLIARALAQQPDVLVMDEPTASLDFGNQQLVLTRLRELTSSGMAILMVTHDPDHALFCADMVIVMEDGVIIEEGTPQDTITDDIMMRIYGTEVKVVDVDLGDGRKVRTCVPLMANGRYMRG
jgi:iron complex transport system ATP-binding protein